MNNKIQSWIIEQMFIVQKNDKLNHEIFNTGGKCNAYCKHYWFFK